MKRTLIVVVLALAVSLFPVLSKEKTPPCRSDINHCPREGCSPDNHHDPELNKLKNIKWNNDPAEDRTLTWMINREKNVNDSDFVRGGPRGVLTDLKEGTNIRVVGYLLAVKQEGGESCNCYLDEVDVTTDNHLVLVNPQVIKDIPLPAHASKKALKALFLARERQSVTAEFTPRVRADGHPNFTSELQSMLNKTPQGALWVRVTGQQMFDSEHFHHNPLPRATSWEIHPIMKLEYCPQGKTCKKDTDDNWVNLDDQP